MSIDPDTFLETTLSPHALVILARALPVYALYLLALGPIPGLVTKDCRVCEALVETGLCEADHQAACTLYDYHEAGSEGGGALAFQRCLRIYGAARAVLELQPISLVTYPA